MSVEHEVALLNWLADIIGAVPTLIMWAIVAVVMVLAIAGAWSEIKR